jgi:hypothetical protein
MTAEMEYCFKIYEGAAWLSRVQRSSSRVQRGSVRVQHGSVRMRRGSVRVQRGSFRVQRGSVRVQRSSVRVQHGSVGSALACCKAWLLMEVPPTEPTTVKNGDGPQLMFMNE